MDHQRAKARAERFRALHNAPEVLLLPCVWDAVSAKLYETAGFDAVGTTSAGIAATVGLPDGQRIGIEETVDVVRRIVACVELPVSADIEAGYAESPCGVAEVVRRVVEAGAVGINIEDSLSGCGIDHYAALFDASFQGDRISAIRGVAESLDIPVVINARTDVFLVDMSDPAAVAEESARRGNAYLAAGADCVFVPDMGNLDEETIVRLAREIDGPISLIAGDGTPPVGRLREIGVARLSFGPRAMRTSLWHLREMAREWLDHGTYDGMLRGELNYETVNGWFSSG
jgi:2-methylisocitrate lyase-like PEP mutase family enzyme